MKAEHDIDPRVRQAYDALNATSAGPSPDADRKLRDYARSAPAGRSWIWPLSLAASAALCLIFVSQFSRILTPEPLPPQAQSSPIATPPPIPPREVAVGDTTNAPTAVRDLRPWVELETAEDWWQQMRLHAQSADRAALRHLRLHHRTPALLHVSPEVAPAVVPLCAADLHGQRAHPECLVQHKLTPFGPPPS